MIEFHKVKISDADFIHEKLNQMKIHGCEHCFGNIFSYSAKLKIEIADAYGCLVVKCTGKHYVSYMFPCGDGDKKAALEFIIEDAQNGQVEAYLTSMSKEESLLFSQAFGDRFTSYANRDAFDYVYLREDLVSLKGKKYQSKRNHISYFEKNNNWSYEEITKDNIESCLQMSRKWLENQADSEFYHDLLNEFEIIKCIFENYDKLGYIGAVLKIDGEVVAYTMGEPLSDDTFCTHIEKAYSFVRGAYPAINRYFAQNSLNDYTYINREDDVGAENLRKAKLSYHPAFLLEKYEAKIF